MEGQVESGSNTKLTSFILSKAMGILSLKIFVLFGDLLILTFD